MLRLTHLLNEISGLEKRIKKIAAAAKNEDNSRVARKKGQKADSKKHSDLYTDENPEDTVSIKFRTKQDVVDTVNSSSFKSKSHQRQSQIINLIEQRLRVSVRRAKDPKVKARLKQAHEYIKSKCEASKLKTKMMRSKQS